ncbi:MAG: T9SS type A sorting domain-containing protein [Desulfobulbaceae bacterium]|nr:T9SS type A sorting domain-containing protein [Desulfobulbaceae bacterium]
MMLRYSLTKKFSIAFLLFLIPILMSLEANSQSWVAQNQQDGFILKKVVSDTTIATGQPFSYTIYFTIPAGATNVTITDQIPVGLQFLAHSFTSACGTPTVVAPAVNAMGGTYSLSWASLPSGCTGSFTVTVAFPNGVTCPGTSVRNNVCLIGMLNGKDYDFCTPFVTTIATAVNPWGINKYPLGVSWQGGNCPYATGNDTITYQVCVYKSVGTTGQLNLVNGVVRDTLPTGAVLVNSNCGATQSGNIITWNVGNLSALPSYNAVCCQFVVYYPPALFPNGTNITNKATLSGSLGSANQPCSNFNVVSNQTCVQKLSFTSGSISKWAYTNRQPGCSGQYLIYICNTGTTPIVITALDTLPSQLSNYSLGFVWGLNATLNSGIVSITDTLAPGACGYVYINFTIPANAVVGSTITNCAHLFIPGNAPQTVCNSFVVDAPAPKPCVWKEVCNKQVDYTPGSTFRYRLRVQNTGGMPITGSTITDVLNPNLEYIGNPSSYISNSYNTPCTTTPANPWTGVNLSYNTGTNTVTAILDTIPATCQNIFYTNCGMYGTSGVPYYFIEFDVKVRDTAALGSVPNQFVLAGGSLGTTTHPSNIEYVLITGVVGYNLQKGVKKPSDANYTPSISTTAGATVDYRLKMNSSGTAALRHVTFVDLLPRNDGSNDGKIISACLPRGSQYDVTYSALSSSTPAIFSTWNNAATTLSNVNNLSPTGIPGSAFTIGCGTVGTWAANWSAGQKNIAAYFGPSAIGVTGATIDFSGIVGSTAQPKQTACNTFAVSGWTKHLIQSSLPTFQLAGQLESPTACVAIDTIVKPKPCFEELKIDVKCDGVTADGLKKYIFTISAVSCAPATLIISSPDGTFTPSTFTLASSPWSINTNFAHTSANNPITINYSLLCNGEVCRDSIKRDLPDCPNEPPIDECCAKFIHKIETPKISANSSTGSVAMAIPMTAGPAPIKSFTATIVSAQVRRVCGNSASAWTRVFGDITGGNLAVPPAPGPQLLSIFSREAKWGPGHCIDWTKGATLQLNMLFPPFSGGLKCRDTLRYSIRYSFTDCECKTCDTVVTYTVVRKWKFLPWDDAVGEIKFDRLTGEVKPGGDEFQSEQPDITSIIMDDETNGTLWVISPDHVDNDVTITAIEMRSSEVTILEISNGDEKGIVQDDIAYVATNFARGDVGGIKFRIGKSTPQLSFTVNVRYAYKIEGYDETFWTEPIPYLVRVPGAAPDILDIEKNHKPDRVRTYAMYFSSSNGYNQDIAAIGLKPTNNMRILAVGPPNAGDEPAYLVPRKQDDGSYIITVPGLGIMGVEALTRVSPIYITLSNVDDTNAEIEFTTFDGDAVMVSTGNLMLTNPISSVMNDGFDMGNDSEIQSVIPNPANNTATITISVKHDVTSAKLSIVDVLGREVITVTDANSLLMQGTHLHSVDVSKLPTGMYFVTFETNNSVVSKPLSIVR